MVNEQKQDSGRWPGNQGVRDVIPEPNKINASTPYDFSGGNLTPYGGLLPVITMLEKPGFQSLVEQTVTLKRIPRAMDLYRFVLGIVLGLYIGFPRLNQLRFIARDPILTGILKVAKLPVQSTFWRFVNTLDRNVARQILTIMRTMRERVWEAANVKMEVVTIDTDATVHTVYGRQMGGRKSYNPKNKGKKSYPPMLTFIAETREYVWGELRNGDRPSGKQIGDHLPNAHAALPPGVKQVYGRADSGFYCWDAVEAYEEFRARFVICSRKTSRLVEELRQAEWKSSPKTDAEALRRFDQAPENIRVTVAPGFDIVKWTVTSVEPALDERRLLVRFDGGEDSLQGAGITVLKIAYEYLAPHLGVNIFGHGFSPIREALVRNNTSLCPYRVEWKRGPKPAPYHGLAVEKRPPYLVIQVRLFGDLVYHVHFPHLISGDHLSKRQVVGQPHHPTICEGEVAAIRLRDSKSSYRYSDKKVMPGCAGVRSR